MIGASFLIMFTAVGHITGLGLGFGTVLASHIAFCIPIVVIVVLPQLYEMNNNILNAARDLGASESQILGRIDSKLNAFHYWWFYGFNVFIR